jgi:hypothetical protein
MLARLVMTLTRLSRQFFLKHKASLRPFIPFQLLLNLRWDHPAVFLVGGTDHEVKFEGQHELRFGKTLCRYQSLSVQEPIHISILWRYY